MNDTHSPTAELAYLPLRELTARLDDGRLTSRVLIENAIARIEALEIATGPDLNAIAELCDDALDQADRLDAERQAGTVRSPLHGIPILIKDNVEVAGLRSAAGSFAIDAPAWKDARIVAELRAAGLVILGSTAMAEFAGALYDGALDGYSSRDGLTGNPYGLDRSPGGSSSGAAAALAAGMAPLAIGSDTVGSAAYPASVCGVTALRSTALPIDLDGVVPYSARYDRLALMARTATDVLALYNVLRGTPLDNVSVSDPLDFTFVDDFDERLSTDISAMLISMRVDVADQEFVCRVAEPPTMEPLHWEHLFRVLQSDWHLELPQYLDTRDGVTARSMSDVAEAVRLHQRDGYYSNLAEVDTSDEIPTRDEIEVWASELRSTADAVLRDALDGSDVLVSAVYGPALKLDKQVGRGTDFSSGIDALAAMAGWGVLTIPFMDVDGLPVGIAITAPGGDDGVLLRAAAIIDKLNPFQPPIRRPNFPLPRRG
jgi:amidase